MKFTIIGDEIYYDGLLYAVITKAALPTTRGCATEALLNPLDQDEILDALQKEYDAGYNKGFTDGLEDH